MGRTECRSASHHQLHGNRPAPRPCITWQKHERCLRRVAEGSSSQRQAAEIFTASEFIQAGHAARQFPPRPRQRFDVLVQSLEAIGKIIDPNELIILYMNSLPIETFGNWIQTQLGFIDNMSITDFKGRVREEARRLNLVGMGHGLGIEYVDTALAHFARGRRPGKTFPPCGTCSYTNHAETNCRKWIAGEHIAKQVRRQQNQQNQQSGQNSDNKRFLQSQS